MSIEPSLRGIVDSIPDLFMSQVLQNFSMKELAYMSQSCKLVRNLIVSEKDGLFKSNRIPLKNIMEMQQFNQYLIEFYLSEKDPCTDRENAKKLVTIQYKQKCLEPFQIPDELISWTSPLAAPYLKPIIEENIPGFEPK